MKLARLDDERLGLVTDAGFVDIAGVFAPDPHRPYVDPMVQLIERWDDFRAPLAALERAGFAHVFDPARLGPPLRRPRKMVNLCTEIDKLEAGQKPPIDWFFKSPESVTGPHSRVVLPPHYATGFHVEAEIAVVIGRSCRNVSADEADSVIFGYTAIVDGMGAGLGRVGMGTYFNKSFDTFCPMGPALVVNTKSGLNAASFSVQLALNDVTVAQYSVGDLAHSIPELIADVSSYFQLLPGDIVACGSPMSENFQIAHRDTLKVDVSGIGSMSLDIDDPLCHHRERVA
ncbi:MAG: fumarylacetoacetate hydrolase family protein [Chloroflexota bacterium]